MKKIITSFSLLLATTLAFGQQLGDGYAPIITDFNVPLLSGSYSGLDVTAGATPDPYGWQHFFAIRHGNSNYNYQLQIASSFLENDRLFFRKLATTNSSPRNSGWVELATRGSNNFIGDQIVNGGIVGSGSGDTGVYLSLVNSSKTAPAIAKRWTIYNMTGSYGNSLQFWAYDNLSCGSGLCNNRFTIMDNGNVGIGITIPQNKLDVKGTIHSQEVKVDMLGWSDFVFKKEYDLPTLAEVEKHIKENGHLEDIPSEKEVLENGINLGEMNAKLLQKIEELTLYMIDIKKENDQMKVKQLEFEKTINELRKKSK
ncbi:hypothetical protein [Flavobacterium tructae]|uniref:Cell wall anchor protein n=1 Tax=Flavobacterium tructae TaxID=1114873 RepID=A0A1S1J0D6_9FLAO|nr:hypothetical protein [Flavobacterium tructae]OHT44032.1 hypothetical protein BHE19_13940 [Flavobacterium tructae]OXB20328.1 hypothetical protein B0A71_08055 [Flavobacterium tructae]